MEAVISGGRSPYKVKWDNGQVGERASYKTSGYHYVIVEDAKGCGLLQDFKVMPINQVKLANEESLPMKSSDTFVSDKKTEVSIPESRGPMKFDSPAFQVDRSSLLKGNLMDFVKGSDGTELKFEVLKASNSGELRFSYDGKFDYQPKVDYQGRDAFTVSICDDSQCLLGRIEIQIGAASVSDNSN
jgi:hypothetical protein